MMKFNQKIRKILRKITGFTRHSELKKALEAEMERVKAVETERVRLEETLRAELMKVEKALNDRDRQVNYLFMKSFADNVCEDIASYASTLVDRSFLGATFKKLYSSRDIGHTHTSKLQSFITDLYCLAKINETIYETGIARHFPVLVDFDLDNLHITMSDCGVSLDNLKTSRFCWDIKKQCYEIFKTLEIASITHCDMYSDGRNMTIDRNGTLYFIDFEHVLISNVSYSLDSHEKFTEGRSVATESVVRNLLSEFNVQETTAFGLKNHQPTDFMKNYGGSSLGILDDVA